MTLSIQEAVMSAVQYELLQILPNDTPVTNPYWSATELLGYYNIAITRAIAANQEALTKTIDLPMQPGVEQSIPTDANPVAGVTDGVRVLKIPANVPYPGLKRPGILEVSAEAMFDAAPDWYAKVPTRAVRHVIFYPPDVEPLRFRVDPPNDGTGVVVCTYAYAPPDATSVNSPFGLTEAYRDPIFNYIMARALGKNTVKQDITKSNWFMAQFNQGIGVKVAADQKTATIAGSSKTGE